MNLWHPLDSHANLAFRVDYDISWQAVALRIMRRTGNTTERGVVEWHKHEPGNVFEPTFCVKDSEDGDGMQNLFNALWDSGYRPPQRVTQTDIIEAKDAHLADLRNIIFSSMGVKE